MSDQPQRTVEPRERAWAIIERATRAVERDQGHSGGTGSLNFRRALVSEIAEELDRAKC